MSEGWHVVFLPEAWKDLERLDDAVKRHVDKAIAKIATNPLPRYLGGYGDPLSNLNDARLAGLCKVKLKKDGIRIVYKTIEQDGQITVIIIGARADNEVYREADRRRRRHGL